MNLTDDLVGKLILGRYRIVRILAQGGMGMIYLGRSEGAAGFIRPVVVKRIITGSDGSSEMVRLFKREANIMSQLRHPGIVSVIDFGREETAYLMVLDYVHGFHLGRWNRFLRHSERKFEAEHAIHITIQILEALHYAHTLKSPDGMPLNIVHRDVTPSNVLLDIEGHVKLADFGIAQIQTDKTEITTGPTTIKGKLAYIAPELYTGTAKPSPQTDVYSAGVVLHEILTGKNEFQGQDLFTTAARVLEHKASSVRDGRASIPPGLDEIIAIALAKKPEERYKTCAEFAAALRAIRSASTEEIQTSLAAAVRSDFASAEMSEYLGTTPLSALEAAWRETSITDLEIKVSSAPPPPTKTDIIASATTKRPPSTGQKKQEDPTPQESPVTNRGDDRRQDSPWLMLLISVLTSVLIVGGGLWYWQTQQRTGVGTPLPVPDAAVSVVEPFIDREDQEDATSGTVAVDAGTSVANGGTPRNSGDDLIEPARLGGLIQRAMNQRSGRIQRCVQDHLQQANGQVRVRLVFAKNGMLQSATVQEAHLQGSPFARCTTTALSGIRLPGRLWADDVGASVPIDITKF